LIWWYGADGPGFKRKKKKRRMKSRREGGVIGDVSKIWGRT